MKRVLRFLLSFLMATTIFTAKAKADGYVDITFVVGKATMMGKSGTFTVTVPYDKPLRSTLFTSEGSDEVCPEDPFDGLRCWSLGTDGISDFTPEELREFCPKYDVTLYATYSRKLTLTFDLQGGSYQGFDTCAFTVIPGRTYDFSNIVPESNQSSTAFAGWSDDGKTVDYNCVDMEHLRFTQDTTYYAVYAPAVRVRFHATEGYFEDNGSFYAELEVKAPKNYRLQYDVIPKNSKENRHVAKWGINGTEVTFDARFLPNYAFKDNVDLYAVWEDKNPVMAVDITSDTSFTPGNVHFLTAKVYPGEVYNDCTFRAYSSDASVVRVRQENGYIYMDARSVGTARITIYAIDRDGNYVWDTETVTVHAEGDPAACTVFGFCRYRGKQYWYEDGVRQGIMGDPKNITDTVYGYERGREIYDPDTNAWYWLDAIYDGAKAVSKEVWMPYIYQSDLEAGINKQGKWVRYNKNGAMIKGWYRVDGEDIELYPSQAGNRYYYDRITGEMVKGYREIDGKLYHFDENTGVLQN